MKTQINTLLSGTKVQFLNPEVDYSKFPKASSHSGHSGSNSAIVNDIWENVINENKESITIELLGEGIILTANWSHSGLSCSYWGDISSELLNKLGIVESKNEPSISIQGANLITVCNGKNHYKNVCPSLITIR